MSTDRSVVLAAATAIWLAVAGFLAVFAVSGILAPLLRSVGVAVEALPASAVFRTAVPAVGFGAVGGAYAANSGRVSIRVDSPDRRDIAWILAGPIVLLLVLMGLTVAANALGLSRPPHGLVQEILEADRPQLLLVLIPLSITFTGPGEELLFRGAVQGRLRASMGPIPAILGASGLFAVVHGGAFWGPGVVVVLLQIFLLTLVLGVAYERRNNIVVPALIHGFYNAAQFAMTYVSAAGV